MLCEQQQKLAKNAHTYSLDQIKKALIICIGTPKHLSTRAGETIFADHLLKTVGLNTREDWKRQGKKTEAFVRFNSHASNRIKQGNCLKFHHELSTRLEHVVSRQPNKQLSHNSGCPTTLFEHPFLLSPDSSC